MKERLWTTRYVMALTVLGGIGISIAGSLRLLVGKDITQILIARVLQGIGFGLSTTATSTLISMICHPTRLPEGIGHTAAVQSLTAVIGPPIGFWIIGAQYDRFMTLFVVAAGIACVTLFIMALGENASGIGTRQITKGHTRIRYLLISLPSIHT